MGFNTLRAFAFLFCFSIFSSLSAQSIFISEFFANSNHIEEEEFIEIAGPTGTILTGWQIVLYEGTTGTVYDTHTFTATDIIGFTDTLAGQAYGVVLKNYEENSLQYNGKNGIALINTSNEVIQFLSYGGTFTATDGLANGSSSQNVGPSDEEVYYSLCREIGIVVIGGEDYCQSIPDPGKITPPDADNTLKCWECDDTGIWSNNKNVKIGFGQPSPSSQLSVSARKEGVSTGVYIDGGFTGAFTGLSVYSPGVNNFAADFRGNIKIDEGLINLHDKFTMQVAANTLSIVATSVSGSSDFKFFDNGKLELKRLDAVDAIYAKEVHVRLPGLFPDYVFAEDYNLPSLDEVKSFIEKNKHLPNYPSAAEVEKNGIGVGELQIKQMETIEELMLYVIELKEEIERLKVQVNEMDK